MASRKNFALTRASSNDLPELCRLQYKCFPQQIREIFMGCKTEDDLPRLAQHYEKSMRENPNDIWIKVTDPATGRIVSASNWRVYVNETIPDSDDAEIPEWLDAEDFERSRKVIQPLSEIRRKQNQGGFVHLHICFTDPDYRRQGAGGLMMQWGCDVADQLFLPAWVEASPEGNYLYKRFGFYDLGRASEHFPGTIMRRDARRTVIEGGKGSV